MNSSSRPDTGLQQSAMDDIGVLLDTAPNVYTEAYATPLSQVVPGSCKPEVPIGDSRDIEKSPVGALSELPPGCSSREPPSAPQSGSIHNVPVEILLRIFRPITLPRTRWSLYALLKLTHVCRFWRVALIDQPQMWSAIFVTKRVRRSFVEACLERSHSSPLDVTVDAFEVVPARPGCTCNKDGRKRLLPNETNPCEWHFQFEPLAEPKHRNRIRALDIDLNGEWIPMPKTEEYEAESCRFFTSSFPRLVTLRWKGEVTLDKPHPLSVPSFPTTLRSLTYVGVWTTSIAQVGNLTSFVFNNEYASCRTRVEAFRSFLLNNRSLEFLGLKRVDFCGAPNGPPVHLPNLKSLNTDFAYKKLSAIVRVPAFSNLSSLRISLGRKTRTCALHAAGDGIIFSTTCFTKKLAETWEDFTGYARPSIHHIRLVSESTVDDYGDHIAFCSLMSDVHILEIGTGYFPFWYRAFLHDLKQLGPQLKIIRFAIPDKLESFKGSDEYEDWGGSFLGQIEELVKYRFEQGRPFSVVERMTVDGSEQINRQRDHVWRCFYANRKLSQYVLPI